MAAAGPDMYLNMLSCALSCRLVRILRRVTRRDGYNGKDKSILLNGESGYAHYSTGPACH